MTAWQLQFGFVPSRAVVGHVLEVDRANLWHGTIFPDSLVESLDKLSPDSSLISSSHMRWGDETASFIDVFVERNRLVDVLVTLDLRVSCLKFVSDLTLVANRHEWLAITTRGRIFRPTVRRFLVEIHHSPAMRWVRGSLDAFVLRQLRRKGVASSLW